MEGEIKANAINEIKQILKRIDMSTEELAKEFLTRKGYYVGNLWSIDDVHYECVPFEAMGILDKALTNDATMEQIWLAIDIASEELLTKNK